MSLKDKFNEEHVTVNAKLRSILTDLKDLLDHHADDWNFGEKLSENVNLFREYLHRHDYLDALYKYFESK